MPEVIAIMFSVLLALGFVWRRSIVSLILLAGVVGLAAAVLVGDWSFVSQIFTRLDLFIYYSAVILGYIAFFVAPGVSGALAGFGMRRVCRRFGKHDDAS